MCVFSLGLAVGVVVAVGMLLVFQVRSIVRNRTGIEDWILEKAKYRRENSNESFIFPYDLGRRRNIEQVLSWTCAPIGNGILWEIDARCDQYTLTVNAFIIRTSYFENYIYKNCAFTERTNRTKG